MKTESMNDPITRLPDPDQVRRLYDLSGRVALITGAASGLGKAMAWGLACHGADIVIVDRDVDKAATCADEISKRSGRRAVSFGADVASETDVQQAVAAAVAAFGDINILVNNAGHNIRKPLIDFSSDEFDSLYAVHVRGAFLFCRALAPRMQVLRTGSIINIASMLGQVAAHGVAPYAAAKAALAQLSRVFALEMAPYGVRVNAIAPGYIDTPLTRQHTRDVRKRITDLTPLGRFGEARELIGPVVFLASEASTFITGSTLVIDGGWTVQ